VDNASAESLAKLSNNLGLIVKRAQDVGKSFDPYESVGELRAGSLLRLGKSRILSRHTTDIQILCLIYLALIGVVAASLFLGDERRHS
jgi:hypothetical protein